MSQEIEYLYPLAINSGSGTYFYNSEGLHMNAGIWLFHTYTPISPANKTYYYDIVASIDAGNQFYIGWERFDADKTNRSNNACVYIISLKPSSDTIKRRFCGTVNLSTDGTNPTAFIRLRILNAWTGTDSESTKQAIIHSLSLREVSSGNPITQQSIQKNGQFNVDYLRESYNSASFSKNGFVDGGQFYEY